MARPKNGQEIRSPHPPGGLHKQYRSRASIGIELFSALQGENSFLFVEVRLKKVDESLRYRDSEAYQPIISDIQACLRLMLLAELHEMAEELSTHRYDHTILECYRSLSDKPALSEKLLSELKSAACSSGH